MIIELPSHLKELLDLDLFELEDSVDPHLLSKYLYYTPEITRVYGLIVADLKSKVREAERRLKLEEASILLEINDSFDSHKYKNEQLRTAKVTSSKPYQEVLTELNILQSDIDTYQEYIWKFRNLQNALEMIAKLRIAEQKY